MQRIVLDDQTRLKLRGLSGPTELCDSSGRPLGYFISPESYMKLLDALEGHQAADRAELERISKEPGGRSLQAILADLEKK
jgi:hypothetical protein